MALCRWKPKVTSHMLMSATWGQRSDAFETLALFVVPCRPRGPGGGSGSLLTCDVLLDLVDFADGVVSSEHVQVEELGVSADARPRADVWRRPPANTNSVVRLRRRSQ